MPTTAAFITFLVAALTLNLTPGVDMMYVLARSLGQGRRAGVVSAAGIFVGCAVHTIAAAAGLAAVLRSSAVAFDVVRYAGAAYLVYLGVQALARPQTLEVADVPQDSLRTIFYQGVVTNVLNPKVALFFLAFLPQFADPHANIALQILFLGTIFNVGGTLVNIAVAYGAAGVAGLVRNHPRLTAGRRWITGGTFLGLGLWLALKRR